MTWIELAGLRALTVGDPDASITVLILHGFQMQPDDLAPFAQSIGLPAWFVFPEAPLPAEPRGRAWWHIDARARDEAIARGARDFASQHPPDLPAARARFGALLDALPLAGRPLVIVGFSQGGMVAFDSLVRAPRPIAALALLSSSRIAHDEQAPLLAAHPLAGIPVLVSHGRANPDLAFTTGEALRDAATAAGATVDWLPFDGGHEIPLVVWRRLRKLVQSVLPPG